MEEHIIAHLAVAIHKELTVIALGNGELGDALVGQRIVIVADTDMFGIYHVSLNK